MLPYGRLLRVVLFPIIFPFYIHTFLFLSVFVSGSAPASANFLWLEIMMASCLLFLTRISSGKECERSARLSAHSTMSSFPHPNPKRPNMPFSALLRWNMSSPRSPVTGQTAAGAKSSRSKNRWSYLPCRLQEAMAGSRSRGEAGRSSCRGDLYAGVDDSLMARGRSQTLVPQVFAPFRAHRLF